MKEIDPTLLPALKQDLVKGEVTMICSMRSIVIGLCLLLDMPVSAQEKPPDAVTARLFAAISKKDVAAVRSLLASGVKANVLDKDGTSALAYAAQNGSYEICSMLLDKGAQPNQQANEETVPLELAVQSGNSKLIALLFDRGADVNHVGLLDRTALSEAVASGKLPIVQLVIDRDPGWTRSALER